MNLKRRFRGVNIRKRLVKRLHKLIETQKFDFNLDNDVDDNAKLSKQQNKNQTQMQVCEDKLYELLEKFFNMNTNKKELKEISVMSSASNRLFEVIDKDELKDIIRYVCTIDEKANLNWISVSNLSSFSFLFSESVFNGDISEWNVSNITDMHSTFRDSKFNGNISKWDVSNVENMESMFENSQFNQDISKWNINILDKDKIRNAFNNCKISFRYKPRRLNRFTFKN